MSAKLTPAQNEVLRELAKPGAWAGYMIGDGFYMSTGAKVPSEEISAVVNSGYADKRGYFSTTIITHTGRAYLASLDAQNGVK